MEEKFEQWAMVELYGHQRIVGMVMESTIGGCSFVRVDVPETNGQKAFTRYFGNNAIYSINPITEEIARSLLKNFRNVPVSAYDLNPAGQMLEGPNNDVVDEE